MKDSRWLKTLPTCTRSQYQELGVPWECPGRTELPRVSCWLHPGARFDLATNEVFGTGDDRRQRNLAKGDKIALAGRLRSNDFEDDDGTKRRVIEVHASSIEFINVKSFRNG